MVRYVEPGEHLVRLAPAKDEGDAAGFSFKRVDATSDLDSKFIDAPRCAAVRRVPNISPDSDLNGTLLEIEAKWMNAARRDGGNRPS